MNGLCPICVEVHRQPHESLPSDADPALFGEDTEPLVLIPIDVERRVREEFEVPDGDPPSV